MATVKIDASPFSVDARIPAVPVPQPELQADVDTLCWAVLNAKLVLGGQVVGGPGAIYVGSQALSWWSSELGYGYQFAYKKIMIHAISRDLEAFPQPCVYLQLDVQADEDMEEGGAQLQKGEEDIATVSEVRLVPEDVNAIDALYQAISIGQNLHPDDNDDDDEDEDEDSVEGDSLFFSADAMEGAQFFQASDYQQGVLDHLDSVLVEPEQHHQSEFEDADEEQQQ